MKTFNDFRAAGCARCGQKDVPHIMSKFNTDEICMACKSDEEQAPNYKRASDAERGACLRGDFNFTGIGLSPADLTFLADKRAERLQASDSTIQLEAEAHDD